MTRAIAAASGLMLTAGAFGVTLPPGFGWVTVASGFADPVGIAFADDGRMFVAEQRGIVWVVENGRAPVQFIDLQAEVQGVWDRGLLGIALDPGFLANRHVYLLYTVDPVFGKPNEDPFQGTFSRLTRYTGTAASNGNVADLDSRLVLIGETAPEGIPVCEPSHTIGSVRFGHDGSLLVSAGDGANFNVMDPGGLDADCFGDGMFGEDENIGAFRSQYLGSLAGKILRIDPATGLGLPDNPFWTGNAADKASKVWALGLRNPFRITVRPQEQGLGPAGPGMIFIGDVGWYTREEISKATGGENFGWPCLEGPVPAPEYPNGTPAHSGCSDPPNPGTLTNPVINWHHSIPNQSFPQGYTGFCAIGGAFYTGNCYPPPYDDALFLADHIGNWFRALKVDASGNFVSLHLFGTGMDRPVDIRSHPATGDLYYVAIYAGEVRRIFATAETVGDTNGDCVAGILDLLELLGTWGFCPGCPADFNGDNVVDVLDLLMLLGAWS